MSGDRNKYDPNSHPREAEFLCQRGATDREMCEFWDIQPSTFYYWRNRHPEFAEAMKVGKDIADDRVERSLYNRAVGYSYDSVKIQAVSVGNNGGSEIVETPYVEHVPPDTKAAIRWLEARRPEVWRRSLALTGAGGGPIEVKEDDTNFSGLDKNERAQLRTLLERASAESRPSES